MRVTSASGLVLLTVSTLLGSSPGSSATRRWKARHPARVRLRHVALRRRPGAGTATSALGGGGSSPNRCSRATAYRRASRREAEHGARRLVLDRRRDGCRVPVL